MTNKTMQQQWANSHLSGGSMAYVDALYEDYLLEPNSAPDVWRDFFNSLPGDSKPEISHKQIREYFVENAKHGFAISSPAMADSTHEAKQAHLMQLINAFRMQGHLRANLDPIHLAKRKNIPTLTLAHHGLSDADLQANFETHSPLFDKPTSLANIIKALEQTYCHNIGVEYMHITDSEQLEWLQQALESTHGRASYSLEQKKAILKQLTAAEGLEKYLGSKYVGQKRFSLEGGDSLIPMMHHLIHAARALLT